MFFIEITTTIGCKNNCVYCPQHKFIQSFRKFTQDKPIRLMSLTDFQKIVDKVPKLMITFAGMSEPFLNPACTDMVLYAHRHNHEIYLFTTLVGLSITNFDRLRKEIPLYDKTCRFFVHLPSEGDYEKIVVDDNYLKMLEHVIQSGVTVSFHFHGKKLHSKVKQMLQRYKQTYKHEQLVSRSGQIRGEGIKRQKKKFGKLLCQGYEEIRGHVVMPDGSVVLCCNDFGMQHPLGNLLQSTLAEIQASHELQRVKQGMNDDRSEILCRYCHMATDGDLVAKYHNSTNLVERYKLHTQVFLYNNFKFLYSPLRSIKQMIHGKTDQNYDPGVFLDKRNFLKKAINDD